MRIAIASTGMTEDSNVEVVSGRASYYLIFDEGNLIKVLKNPFKFGGGGAGFGVASVLGDENVDLVIAGSFGMNMQGALKEKGIKFKTLEGVSVKEAIEQSEK
jgi:predicted Fe-Mo cluster-binding NifX family protein